MKQETFIHWYGLLLEYNQVHGDLLVPQQYVTSQGEKLGKAVHSIRSENIELSEEQKRLLNGIGFVWRVKKRGKSTIYKKTQNK